MKAKLLQRILVFGILTITSSIVNAWQEPPVEAIILNWDPLWATIGVEQCFDGSASYGQGGISWWMWTFGDGSTPYDGYGSPPSCVTDPYSAWAKHTYTAIAHRTAKLEVLDAYSNYDSEEMDVYVVNISLSAGSTYVCRNLVPIYLSVQTVKMDDKARLMIHQEPGAIKVWKDASKSELILPYNGQYQRDWNTSYFTTPKTYYVEGLPTSYEQHPKLAFWYVGWNGYAPFYPPGAQPEVNFTVGSVCDCPPPSNHWMDFLPGTTCPPGCSPLYQQDDCGNQIWCYCDSINHLSSLAWSWWYKEAGQGGRGMEIGMCVWEGGVNQFRYNFTYPAKRFLKTEHWTCNDRTGGPHWYPPPEREGCWNYWCYRHVWYDCFWHLGPIVTWHRKHESESSDCPCAEGCPNPLSDEPCPGPTYPLYQIHPGWPD